jgi:hypothetical protein
MTRQPANPTPGGTFDRVDRRTIGERRRRVVRRVVLVLFVTVLVLLLSIVLRDARALQEARVRANRAAEMLHDRGEVSQRFNPYPDDPAWLDRFLDEMQRNTLFTSRSNPGGEAEMGVFCSKRPYTRLFMSDGRLVILYNYNNRRYYVRWMEEQEFLRRARDLGFSTATIRR